MISEKVMNYKKEIIGVMAVLLVAIITWGIYANYSNKRDQRLADQVYLMEQNELKALKEKRIDGATFVKKLLDISKEMNHFVGLAPTVIDGASFLHKNGDLASASALLEHARKEFLGENRFLDFFILYHSAVVYEDLGKNKEAIVALEKLVGYSMKVLEGKIYLDLGRLYLKIGEKEKARSSLKYAADNSEQLDWSRMAKLYLEEINKK